jgi:hypothetical protein
MLDCRRDSPALSSLEVVYALADNVRVGRVARFGPGESSGFDLRYPFVYYSRASKIEEIGHVTADTFYDRESLASGGSRRNEGEERRCLHEAVGCRAYS